MLIALFTALTSLLASFGTRTLAFQTRVLDQVSREARKIHQRSTPLLGGVGIALAIIVGLTLAEKFHLFSLDGVFGVRVTGFFIGMLILLIGGVLDDVYDLPPGVQVIFPVLAALVVIVTGSSIVEISSLQGSGVWRLDIWSWRTSFFGHLLTFRFPADLITLAWLLGVTYATKVMDGLDGLVTGQTIVGAILILFLASSPAFYQPSIVVFAWIVLGAFLGFLPYNLHPARQFLGESGSTLAGFTLGFLAIVSGAKVATTFMALGIPLVDFILVVLLRIRAGHSPFKGDASHLHFRLLKLGFSQRQVAALFWMLALIFGLAALGLQTRGKTLLMLGLVCLTVLLSLGAAAKQYLSSRWRKGLFLSALCLTILVASWSIFGLWRAQRQMLSLVQIRLNERPLFLELATTQAARTQGLSDRLSMRNDHGMLFVFPKQDRYTFWMPRMHFDLDIIWIKGDQVVDVRRLSAPVGHEAPTSYTPSAPADRVLELVAGQAQIYDLKIGSRVPELQLGVPSP